jgi:hypothetical protein
VLHVLERSGVDLRSWFRVHVGTLAPADRSRLAADLRTEEGLSSTRRPRCNAA